GTVGIGLRRQAAESNNEVHTARISGFEECLQIGTAGQTSDVLCEDATIQNSPRPGTVTIPNTPVKLRIVGG
ncbi:MAG: hypothetical protein ACRDJ9_28490, partial [Dehalococcoidia bacterium]